MEFASLIEHAEHGIVGAQFSLAVLFATGKGVVGGKAVQKDSEKAIYWYTKAAEQGFGAAQYNLGVHFENGEGVHKNARKAKHWYAKAAEQDWQPPQEWQLAQKKSLEDYYEQVLAVFRKEKNSPIIWQ